MNNLIKTDFYRILKAKITYVSFIIAAVVPLLLALLYLGIRTVLKNVGEPEDAMVIDLLLGGEVMLTSTFSFTNNIGLALPVFAVIIVMSDVNSGTIRNKLILGYKRHQIFASHFVTSFIYCLVLMGIYAAMTALFGGTILGLSTFDYETGISFTYFYILGLLGMAFVAAVSCSLSLSLLNMPGSIIIGIVICLLFGGLASILSSFDYSSFEYFAYLLPAFVINAFPAHQISIVMFLEGLAGIVIFGGIFYVVGSLIFGKRDLK